MYALELAAATHISAIAATSASARPIQPRSRSDETAMRTGRQAGDELLSSSYTTIHLICRLMRLGANRLVGV